MNPHAGQPEELKEQPKYTLFKKKMYKGKMAPQGCLYFMIRFKRKNMNYESCRLIPVRGAEPKELEAIADKMYEAICEKYGIGTSIYH